MGSSWSEDETIGLVSRRRIELETDKFKSCGQEMTVKAIKDKVESKGKWERGEKGVSY